MKPTQSNSQYSIHSKIYLNQGYVKLSSPLFNALTYR